ncbi:YaiI/YqxD family protein [Micavibrio aeruginosavorus]|uniref:YaiI/YqxD family protein n=1 Tax=Micavibrio aeruginosavorus TaxID=349221 RepID=UPI003F4AC0E9
MKIWVDADACPKVIKDLLFKVAERTGVHITLVANQYLFIPPARNISFIQVEAGFDVADQKIVELCAEGDMVVTADIPLAAAIVKKGAFALNPRGELYDLSNIGEILAMRDLMESLRGGMMEDMRGGPAPFTPKDREKFANQLDKFMTRKR